MEITESISLKEYDTRCGEKFPNKVPNIEGPYERRVGDCIYDYSKSSSHPVIRKDGVHTEANKTRDLAGENALLSTHFIYFGRNAPEIPNQLVAMIKSGPGHRSKSNQHLVHPFLAWIKQLETEYGRNAVVGNPILKEKFETEKNYRSQCALRDREEGDEDEAVGSCE